MVWVKLIYLELWAKSAKTLFLGICVLLFGIIVMPTLSIPKKNFFFGKRTNQQIALECCVLSFIEAEEFRSELDESDLMMMDEFQRILDFYKTEKLFG